MTVGCRGNVVYQVPVDSCSLCVWKVHVSVITYVILSALRILPFSSPLVTFKFIGAESFHRIIRAVWICEASWICLKGYLFFFPMLPLPKGDMKLIKFWLFHIVAVVPEGHVQMFSVIRMGSKYVQSSGSTILMCTRCCWYIYCISFIPTIVLIVCIIEYLM